MLHRYFILPVTYKIPKIEEKIQLVHHKQYYTFTVLPFYIVSNPMQEELFEFLLCSVLNIADFLFTRYR